ncbi:DUF2141 domain-containing protein [Halopseudomonas salegens]|uniref:Uncharacterized conserved protein, DUF2141 family n=1 Tax=Halopseudomonas salegens TaxID=1434072 RepID=A0A1H2GUP3_9GAMM|nr:DUF2141 domain-containing protein [Halopseudomonas salegens]SDU23293.1 Uncharacterized conserved protein, DUF2141 family [Halopseudomonas salegens]
MQHSGQWRSTLLASLTGIAAMLACVSVAASPLCLLITDNRSPALPLYLAVYPASAEDWGNEPHLLLQDILPETDTVEIALEIPPGDYAIRAFVDLNGDGELNLNHKDRPTEPFASSLSHDRNRRSQRFEHAIISLSADEPCARLNLTYPRGS